MDKLAINAQTTTTELRDFAVGAKGAKEIRAKKEDGQVVLYKHTKVSIRGFFGFGNSERARKQEAAFDAVAQFVKSQTGRDDLLGDLNKAKGQRAMNARDIAKTLHSMLGGQLKAPRDGREAEVGGGGVGILGPQKEKDTSPTKWMKPLSGEPLDLSGLEGFGDGKKGAQGTTFAFVTRDGRELIGKTDRRNVQGEVAREFQNYETVYQTAGRHKNLGQVHGWADLRLGNQHAEGMLMDKVPGLNGREFQAQLKTAWDDGVISTEQYWSAVQHVTRVVLRVMEHLGEAGLVHNDIKPENYVIDSATGEPIVIDLGGASKIGEQPGAITDEFAAPEMLKEDGTADIESALGTKASDMFTVGSSLQNTVESPGTFHKTVKPNTPIARKEEAFYKDEDGNAVKKPYEAGATTDYTNFVEALMSADASLRPEAAKALRENFLSKSMLGEKESLEVLKGVSSGSLRREWEDRWKAAGKKPPASVERFNKDEIESRAKKLAKEIDNAFSQGDMGDEELRASLAAKVDELELWIKRGGPMGADTARPERQIAWFRRTIEGYSR